MLMKQNAKFIRRNRAEKKSEKTTTKAMEILISNQWDDFMETQPHNKQFVSGELSLTAY